MQAPLLGFFPIRVAGGLLIATGLPVLLDSFARFALKGLGTPAPVFPTRHLVITGLYRYVRNPMYVAGGFVDRWPWAAVGKSAGHRVRIFRLAGVSSVRVVV